MKLLVTGRQGQVARALAERAGAELAVARIGRPEFDLIRPDEIRQVISNEGPDVVVSAAAYTAVDKAEDEPELAHQVNADGAGSVALAAASLGLPVIHLSTDYVFSGDLDRPYREDDPVAPAGVYGRSKLEGEARVRSGNPRHVILRTAWVYSPFGSNFMKTMLRLAGERDELSVVSDQYGNPTSASDIAAAIVHIASRLSALPEAEAFGTFHMAGTGDVNWSGFARTILEFSSELGGPAATVRDIRTRDYPTKAVRPANSRLNTGKLARVYGWRAPDWQTSCRRDVERVLSEPSAAA